MRISKIYRTSDEEFIKIIYESLSIREVLSKLGMSNTGTGSTTILKKRISELNLDISHFLGRRKGTISSKRHDLHEILIANSTYTNTGRLKTRLLDQNLLIYKCYICGLKNWLGSEISLQLDHIDGVSNNNSLSNLRLLCPNCHSQTETYAGRNKRG